MYINYEKLWQKLALQKLSKTDLCNLTGISSRTMAKLSKNESVTTDTLLKICETLDCSLEDIADICYEKKALSIYDAYTRFKKEKEEDDTFKTVEFEYEGISFTLKIVKKALTKKTFVHCTPTGNVTLEHVYPVGLLPARETEGLFHSSQIEKGKVNILLLTGAPGIITGLDDGIVHSAKYGCVENGFYVMTLSAFKMFELKK